MSLSAAAIRLLATKGLSVDEIAQVAEANEAAAPISSAAMRTRRWRENKAKSSRGDVTVTTAQTVTKPITDRHEPSPPRTRVRDITSNSEITGSGGGVGDAREALSDDWPDGDHAKLLVEAADSPWLDPNKATSLITSAGRISAWRRRGASWPQHVLPVVVALAKQHHEPIKHWKFFEPAIARAVAASRAEMELPDVVVPFRQTGPPKTIDEKSSASWEYAMEKIARDEQS